MRIWIVALVLAALQLCAGVNTVTNPTSETVAIGGHGDILAVDGSKAGHANRAVTTTHPEHSLEELSSKRIGLLRQEAEGVGHRRHHTMLERRIWARKHGNVFATHRMLRRSVSWASLYTIKIPATIRSSLLVPVIGVVLLLGFIITIVQCCIQLRQPSPADAVREDGDGGSGGLVEGEEPATPVEHDFHRSPSGLDPDIYGMGVAALIRDSQRIAQGSESAGLRISRMMISLLTLLFTMALQIFLLVEMKHLVTSVSTNEAQDTYEKYEIWMYGNDKSKMDKIENGQVRGVVANFDKARFAGLDDDMKSNICQVPLSQPTFFIAILLVWTLVCTNEMRIAFDIAGALLVSTPTISSMKDSIKDTAQEHDEAVVVIGLTIIIKIACVILVIIPRLCVCCTLLWLGCRWLTGTFGFSDVLQNAVALEFILLLKDVFFEAITPAHNKKETANTMLQPFSDNERPSTAVFLGAFTWGVVSIIWVFFYILQFQQVLPDYQWDIHDACVDYLAGVEQLTPGG